VPDARRDGVVRGDFGGHYVLFLWLADGGVNEVHSTSDTIVRASLPVSAQLGLAALVILYAVGVPLGTLAAIKRGAWIDRWIAVGCTAVKSVPVFVLGPMIVVVLRLEIMDPMDPWGWEGLFSARSILPVVLVALAAMPWVVRITRAGVIDALSQDYVRTARAKGMPERMVVSRHVIRTALTPLVSGLVPTLAALLSGLLLVEVLFGIHGLAVTVINSLGAARDGVGGQTVLAGVVVGAAAWAICRLAADLLHWALDPRLRYNGPVSRSGTAGRALAV
jgi:peptide/nickel transport system permease protein